MRSQGGVNSIYRFVFYARNGAGVNLGLTPAQKNPATEIAGVVFGGGGKAKLRRLARNAVGGNSRPRQVRGGAFFVLSGYVSSDLHKHASR